MTGAAPSHWPRLSIFGLGKLGAALAACHASRGFHVIGVDVDARAVEACRERRPLHLEPEVESLYASCGTRLEATSDGARAVLESDASLILVPTPSERDGSYALRCALDACESIGRALRAKPGAHLVVMKSTVLPGACQSVLVPALEAASGRRFGGELGFCYNPEFVALGTLVRNIFEPDFVLIGEAEASAGERLVAIQRRLLREERPIKRMSIANAELAKLALNAFVTMKISYANLLAQLCERLPGGDIDAVTSALGLDPRIGARALRGGLGYGGPCFPRDNRALVCLADRLGVDFPLATATDRVNESIAARVAQIVAERVPMGGRVAVLGLAYKTATSVVEASQGVELAARLVGRGFAVAVFDPLARDAAHALLGDGVAYASSAKECIADADAVVIATPWEEFRDLDLSPARDTRPPFVVDGVGLLAELNALPANVWRLGRELPPERAEDSL